MANLYNHYIKTSAVTFEEEPVTADDIARRAADVASACLPWLVAEEGARLIGYACAKPWRTRSAYRFSVEISAYVTPDRTGRGVGSELYRQLIPALQTNRTHAVLGIIALPNEASVALHEKFGFRKAAHLQQVGFKFDRWVDVGYWQLTL